MRHDFPTPPSPKMTTLRRVVLLGGRMFVMVQLDSRLLLAGRAVVVIGNVKLPGGVCVEMQQDSRRNGNDGNQ